MDSGRTIPCFDRERFAARSRKQGWEHFEKDPDLVFFPVCMLLDNTLVKVVRGENHVCYVVAPNQADTRVSVVTDFPTKRAFVVGDGSICAKSYVAKLANVNWITFEGAYVHISLVPFRVPPLPLARPSHVPHTSRIRVRCQVSMPVQTTRMQRTPPPTVQRVLRLGTSRTFLFHFAAETYLALAIRFRGPIAVF